MVTEFRPKTSTPPTRDERFSILIADDDRGTRETLSDLLQERGFDTVQAADGGEAVEIVQVNLVHLVLFDMHMPRLTGLEALNILRQTLQRVLPAVLMSADVTTELMRQAFQAQVYSVIPKPVNKNIVLHTLARALEKVYGKLTHPEPAPPHAPRPTDHGNPTPTQETDR
jgi:CheY-like chemotaxis protein